MKSTPIIIKIPKENHLKKIKIKLKKKQAQEQAFEQAFHINNL